METDFRSDNTASVCPEILAALAAANQGTDASYGADRTSAALDARFSALFETRVKVFPVATGTAANAFSLAASVRPWGGVYCYEQAHILTSEGNATELASGGARLLPLAGDGFRISPRTLEKALATAPRARHKPVPDAVSVTEATEHGTLYQTDELAEIGAIARHHGLRFHMDGARLANALAALGCTPAEMTSRAGVDILSFGATKNGGLGADAIVVFDQALAEGLSYRLRRAGHTWSKMRFAAAQLLAYVENGLYLRLAARANALASRLARGLEGLAPLRVIAPVEANVVFLEVPEPMIGELAARGFLFLRRGGLLIRLVCRFDGTEAEVDRFIAAARSLALTTASEPRLAL